MKAIETMYAGTLFRSRLEARWAVYFDHRRIRWEYEPQGFEVSARLDLDYDRTWGYLPDFWLPDQCRWVEVKGTWTVEQYKRFLNAVATISDGYSDKMRGFHDREHVHPFVVLGPVPDPRGALELPWQVCMWKGDIDARPFVFGGGFDYGLGGAIASDSGDYADPEHNSRAILRPSMLRPLHGTLPRGPWPGSTHRKALSAARSARFEHEHAERW